MSFLASVLSKLGAWLLTVAFPIILELTLGKLKAWVMKIKLRTARRAAIKKEVTEAVQPMKDAVSGEEIDRATDSAMEKL